MDRWDKEMGVWMGGRVGGWVGWHRLDGWVGLDGWDRWLDEQFINERNY